MSTYDYIYSPIYIYIYGLHDEIIFFLCWIVQNNMPWISILWNPGPGTCLLGRHILHPPTSRAPCRTETPVLLGVARAPLEPQKYALAIAPNPYIYTYIYILHIYIYIGSRLGVPRSFEEPSVLMLYQKGRSCIQMGGVGGWGGCNNVMWSALDDVESWKMLLGWKMLLRWKFPCCLQKGGWGGV